MLTGWGFDNHRDGGCCYHRGDMGMPQILFNPKARDPISALQPTKPTAKTAPATISSAIDSPCGADSATADRYDVTTTKCR